MGSSHFWSQVLEVCVGAGAAAAAVYPALGRLEERRAKRRATSLQSAVETALVPVTARVEALDEKVDAQIEGLDDKLEAQVDALEDKLAPLATKVAAMDEKLEPVVRQVGALQRQLDVQFGGNGGGLREKVNSSATDVERIAANLDGLKDRFEDHLRIAEEDRRRLEVLERLRPTT